MSETGRADLAPVWPVRTVRNEVDTHLSLGGLDRRVGLARRDRVALRKELEVVDEPARASLTELGPPPRREGRKAETDDSIDSFIEARGGGTILWSSTLI